MRKVMSLLALALTTVTLLSPPTRAAETPGAPADLHFTLKDQNGHEVALSSYAGQILVLEWVNMDCPFVQRHYREGTMKTLAQKYAAKGVVWLAINSTHYATQADNKKWVQQHALPYPILDDSSGQVGRAFDARTTPDMFILQHGKIVYQGAIDNDPSGRKGPQAVNYVARALDEILAGKPVSIPKTRSYGCSVKYNR